MALGLTIVLSVHCDCVPPTESSVSAGSVQPRGFSIDPGPTLRRLDTVSGTARVIAPL